MEIEVLNNKDTFDREIHLVSISNIEDFESKKLPQLSKYFVLFYVDTQEKINIEKLSEIANDLIRIGLVYICTWGKHCEKIHDIFDEEIVELELEFESNNESNLGITEDDVVMTTWHDESLEEALWFFLNNTVPTESYYSECKSSLVLINGNSSLSKTIKNYLENQNQLYKKIFG